MVTHRYFIVNKIPGEASCLATEFCHRIRGLNRPRSHHDVGRWMAQLGAKGPHAEWRLEVEFRLGPPIAVHGTTNNDKAQAWWKCCLHVVMQPSPEVCSYTISET